MVDLNDSNLTDSSPPTSSKVARVIEEYNLDGFGEQLERRWLGVDGPRESLRDLADVFNQVLLEAALEQAGEHPIEGEIENIYRLLTDDDVSTSARTQAETRLARLGLDVEAVKQDLISHQTVYTYLTEVRGASLPAESSAKSSVSKRLENILRLRNRLVAVTARSIESLSQAGRLSLGEFDVMVGITVYCNECDTAVEITDLFERGGCDCPEDTR